MILNVKFQKFVVKEHWYFFNILLATKLKMNPEFGMSLGLKSQNGFQIHPNIYIVRRQQQRFAESL